MEINGVQFLYQACNSVMALGSLGTADQYRVSSGLILTDQEFEDVRQSVSAVDNKTAALLSLLNNTALYCVYSGSYL